MCQRLCPSFSSAKALGIQWIVTDLCPSYTLVDHFCYLLRKDLGIGCGDSLMGGGLFLGRKQA